MKKSDFKVGLRVYHENPAEPNRTGWLYMYRLSQDDKKVYCSADSKRTFKYGYSLIQEIEYRYLRRNKFRQVKTQPALNTAKFVEEITVTDPDTQAPIEMDVFKHVQSDGMFAVDASYFDQCFGDDEPLIIPDPLNKGMEVKLLGL